MSLCHEGLSLSGIRSVYIMSAFASCPVMNGVPTSASLALWGAFCLPAGGKVINKLDRDDEVIVSWKILVGFVHMRE